MHDHRYHNARDAADAIQLYNGKSLASLGGPSNHSLIVQLAGGPREDRFNREGGRTQTIPTSEGSPSKQHQRYSSRSFHGGDRRRDSLPSHMAETSRAYPDVNDGHVPGSAALACQLNLGGETATTSTIENVEMPSQIDPGLSQFNISPQEASVKLPSPDKSESTRQEFDDSKAIYQDKSTMTSPPFAATGGSHQQRASQEYSANTGPDIVSKEADKKSESLIKLRDGTKLAALRNVEDEDSKPNTDEPYTAQDKEAPTLLEDLSQKNAKPKSGETTHIPVQTEKRLLGCTESQTVGEKPFSIAPESHARAKRDGRKSAPARSGKKPERSNKSMPGVRNEQSKDSGKRMITNTVLAGTEELSTTSKPVVGLESSRNSVAKDKEARSAEAGSETLTTLTDPADTGLSKEIATAEQQDQSISLPFSRANSGSAKINEEDTHSSFILTGPTTSAPLDQFGSSRLGSQRPIATSKPKWLPLTLSHEPTKPDVKPVLNCAMNNTSKLQALATVAGQMEYVHVNEIPSVAPKPSTSDVSPPGPVPANQGSSLPTEPSKDFPQENLDPTTTTIKAQSVGINNGGPNAIIEAPYSASPGKVNDRASAISTKAFTSAPDDVVPPESADLPGNTGLKDKTEVPARSSSLVTPATPILTHMKKQRNLKSPQIATENPYSALIPETSNSPVG